MKTITSLFLFMAMFFLAAMPVAMAYDLFEFPSPFAVENDHLDTIFVVGDSAPSSDVVAQTNIALALTGYAGVATLGTTKLASEVDTLDQNIISIGTPCASATSLARDSK